MLLPGLVTFVAAVVFARLFRPAVLALARLTRRRSVSLQLASVSLARHPGHAAVAIAFLVVSVGLAVFAESYRTTLARGQDEQAAYAVPLDFTVREDLSRLVPVVDAAPPSRFSALGRGLARRADPAGRRKREQGRRRNRDHRARDRRRGGAGAPRLAGRLRRPAAGGAGAPDRDTLAAREDPVLPENASALVVEARGRAITLTASVESPRGDFVTVVLGRTEPRGGTLRAPLPANARGGRIVALTLVPPRIVERGADAGKPFRGTLELGRLEAETPSGGVDVGAYEEWIGVNGVEPRRAAEGATPALHAHRGARPAASGHASRATPDRCR